MVKTTFSHFVSLYRVLPQVGRPRLPVDVDDILRVRELHYTWTKIAHLLDISRATLYQRLSEVGISPTDFTPLSEEQLDGIVSTIKQHHPNDGEVLMCGHLNDCRFLGSTPAVPSHFTIRL